MVRRPGSGDVVRWLWLAGFMAAASAGACGSTPLQAADAGGGGAGGASSDASSDAATGAGGASPPIEWKLTPANERQLDILFMVDNSQSMVPLQAKLNASFPAFASLLKALPLGLPDLHLAVISSDTGPGKYDLPSYHCAFGGDRGQFQSQPRANCALPPLAAGNTFLSASANQSVKNYTGDIIDAFTCIAALGDQGCGFEGQLKSVRWALDPSRVPIQNPNFLRDGATLVVILVTNEDDCSLPDDSDLVDPTQTLMSSALGPLWSYRCNEFGHLCNVNGTLQSPPRGAATSLEGCVSNDSPTGKLTKIADEIAFLKTLKRDPNQLIVAAITGPATPYSIEMIQQGMDVEPHPSVVHSCMQSAGEYADPAIRLKQWVDAFGVNGILASICDASFTAPLQTIAAKIGTLFGPVCVSGAFSTPPTSCQVVDRSLSSAGAVQDTPLPSCAAVANVAPCWTLSDDATGCVNGKRLAINRGGAAQPANVSTYYRCAP